MTKQMTFLHHFQSDDDDDIKLLDLSKKGPLNLEGFATCDVNVRLALEDNVSVTISHETVSSKYAERAKPKH